MAKYKKPYRPRCSGEIMFLLPATADELAKELGMKRNVVVQTIVRMRRFGYDIVTVGNPHNWQYRKAE